MPTAPNVTIIPAKTQTEIGKNKYHQLRVAAYCRVSTEQEEQQNSYQVQIAYYTDLINSKKEWSLVGIFADEGISGTQTKNRTEFKRMIRMCKNKKIDLVITKSISRFARNTVDCLEYVRQLKDLGIGVIFEKENINTLTMTSEFMIALYGSFAQAEAESISKNVSWGKEKAYREGRVQFQYKHLLGYKRGDDGKPEIVPDEAETVRLIFKFFLDGYSMKDIAVTLKSLGKVNKYGDVEWRSNTISRILQNEKYVGDALLQKTFTVDCITHKIAKNHGERPMYLVSNHHTPIIDRDTFNRVQQELARRSSKRKISLKTITEQGKCSCKYALSELLICGCCDEDKLDSEFSKLYQEEQQLSERLESLKSQNKTSAETQQKLDKIMDMIEHEKFELEIFDNVLIRKLIECVKVLSKTEILVIFKGGYEIKAEME